MKCSQNQQDSNDGPTGFTQNNREKKREMKFMAKMQQTIISGSTSAHEITDCSQTTETEESDEDGTGNTGKPKPRCCWHETHPRNSELLLEAARRMETLFEATLMTTDTSKGRGGCDGF